MSAQEEQPDYRKKHNNSPMQAIPRHNPGNVFYS
jgi:hypothetical protein